MPTPVCPLPRQRSLGSVETSSREVHRPFSAPNLENPLPGIEPRAAQANAEVASGRACRPKAVRRARLHRRAGRPTSCPTADESVAVGRGSTRSMAPPETGERSGHRRPRVESGTTHKLAWSRTFAPAPRFETEPKFRCRRGMRAVETRRPKTASRHDHPRRRPSAIRRSHPVTASGRRSRHRALRGESNETTVARVRASLPHHVRAACVRVPSAPVAPHEWDVSSASGILARCRIGPHVDPSSAQHLRDR